MMTAFSHNNLKLEFLLVFHFVHVSLASAETGQFTLIETSSTSDSHSPSDASIAPALSLIQLKARARHVHSLDVVSLLLSTICDKRPDRRPHAGRTAELSTSSTRINKKDDRITGTGYTSSGHIIHEAAWNKLMAFAACFGDINSAAFSDPVFAGLAFTLFILIMLSLCAISLFGHAESQASYRQHSCERSCVQGEHACPPPQAGSPGARHDSNKKLMSVIRLSPQNSARSLPGDNTIQHWHETVVSSPGSRIQTKPDPICGELVLTLCESWFAIPFSGIDAAAGALHIFGLSGKHLLTADVRRGEGEIAIKNKDESSLFGSIKSCSDGPMPMLIADKMKNHYGELRTAGHLCNTLVCGNSERMRIIFQEETKQMELMSSTDGSTLAIASKLHDWRPPHGALMPDGKGHLQVKVDMGMDPVLALLCILASVIFRVDS